MENKKVLLGMSGGVDSSVSALLLKKEGYEPLGITLELFAGSSCCNINTYIDAKNVCKTIGIPHFTYNCKELKTFSFKKGLFKNNFMNISIAILFVIQMIVFFTPIGSLFGIVEISWWQFLAVVAVNIVGFLLIELVKPVLNKVFADK